MNFIRINRWTVAGGLFFVFLAITLGIVAAQGGNIAYGQTVKGTVKAGGLETWHFVASGGDLVNIVAHRTSGDLEPTLLLQDSTQQSFAGTQAPAKGDTAVLQVRLPQRGSYLINVGGNLKTVGDYTLTLSLTTAGAVTITPQATTVVAVSAGEITPGTAVHGEITDAAFQQSWHFHGNFGDVIDIRMVRQSGDLDSVLALVSPLGDVISANDSMNGGPDAGILAYELPFTGDYHIIARREGQDAGARGKTSGKYELTLTQRGPGTAAQNTVLGLGSAIQGRLSDNAPVAIYRLEVGGALALSLDLGSLHRLARIRVLSTSGAVLDAQEGMSPLTIAERLPDKGPFLVEASSLDFENQSFTDFSLTLYRLSATIAKATGAVRALHYGDNRQVNIVEGDSWIFIGHSGDVISLGITPDSFFKDSNVLISAPQDVLLYRGDLGAGISQTLTLNDNGIYEIDVHPGASTAPGSYTVALDRIGAKGVAFSLHDNAIDKGSLNLNAPTTGTLTADVADAWWLDATAGQIVNLTLGTTTGEAFLGLSLKRPDGSLANVQVTDRVGGAVIQQALLDQTGRYRVVVFDNQGKAGGQYTIRYEDAVGGFLKTDEPVKGIAVPSNGFSTWSLDVVKGALINTHLQSLTAQSWSPSILVVDPGGHVIATSNAGQGSVVDLLGVEAPVTGTYRVVVGGQVSGTFASYTLVANVQAAFGSSAEASIQVSPVSTTAIPRFGTQAASGPIHVPIGSLLSLPTNADKQKLLTAPTIGMEHTVRGEITRGEFSNAWQYSGTANVTVALTATSLVGSIGPDLTLIDNEGKVVDEQIHSDNATTVLTYRMLRGGQYKVLVRMGLNGGRYLLSLNKLPVGNGTTQVFAGTPLVYGETASGEIISTDQADRYYFLGTAGDVISINLNRATGDLVPELQLIAPNGKVLDQEPNATSSPSISVNNTQLFDDGVYTVQVERAVNADQTTGRYGLSVGINSGFHLGNRGGGILTPGTTVSGLLNVPDLQDTWLFKGHQGERVAFTLTGKSDPLPTPLGLRLQDTAGNTFAARDATLTQGAIELSDITLPADGIYQVQVAGGNETTGAYSLYWQPDQERLPVGPLHYDQTVSGVFTSSHNSDTWVFSGTAGDVISIALNDERGDKFTGALQLRSENGLQLQTAADLGSGAGARADSVLLPFSGSYTLVVANVDTKYKGTGVYSLTVNLQDSKARSMGSALRYGQKGEGDIYVDDSVDTWVFGARAGDVVSIEAQARDQFLKPLVELHSATGALLASAQVDTVTLSGAARIDNFKIDNDGVYAINVSGGTGKTTGSYLLTLGNTPPALREATLINYGETKEGLVADDRPRQVYAFSGKKGDTVTASMTREAKSSLAGTLTIQSMDGSVLAFADARGTETATITNFKLPTTGQYALVASRYLAEQGKTFGRLKVTINGTPEDHTIKGTVNYGQKAIGRLNDENPVDRITFSGKAGDVVGITSKATSGDLDTTLSLENSAGSILAQNDDADGTNAVIVGALLPADDTYTIVVSRAGTRTNASSGNYDLDLSRPYQANATAAPKALIAYGQRIISSVDAQNTEARYAFSGNQGDEVSVSLVHQMDDAPPLLSIQDPVGTILAQGKLGNGQTKINSYRLPVTGLYTIDVKRPLDANQAFAPFELTLTPLSSVAGQASNGGVLAIGSAVTGNFTGSQTAQYWLFQGQAQEKVSASVLPLTGNLTPTTLLIGPGGQGLASFNSSNGTTSASLDQFILPADGVYSLLVLPGDGNRAGQYRLTLQPDSSIPSADAPIAAGQIVTGTLTPSQPQQHWTFNGQQGKGIAARMLVNDGSLIPQLRLVASDGSVLAEGRIERSAQNLTSAVLFTVLPTTGSFTLVAAAQNQVAGDYRLSFTSGAISAQAVAAVPIAYGQSVTQTVQQGGTGFWAFNGAANDTVSLTVLTADNTKAPDMVLQDSSGRVLAQVVDNNSSEGNITGFTLPADGLYVVAISSPITTSYRFALQRRQSLLASDVSPRTLLPDKPLDSELTSKLLVDYWSFNAKVGDVVQIAGIRLNGDVRVDLALYSPTGYLVNSLADASGKIQLGPIRLGEEGKYILVASRWLGSTDKSGGRYTLTLSYPKGVSGSNGGFIPAYGHPVTGGIIAADDNDVWSFDGQGGDLVNIRVTRQDGNLEPAIKLIDATTGKEIAHAQANSAEAHLDSFALPASGRYNIVATRAGKTSGGYKLTVERSQTALQTSMSHAAGIEIGNTRTGELTQDAPAQAWVFFGKAGQRITAEAAPSASGSLDPYLYVLGTNGTVLEADNDSGGDRKALVNNLLLPADGFYGVVVTGNVAAPAEQHVGSFTLTLQQDQPGAAYQGSLDVGASVTGQLLVNQPAHEWTFQADASKTIAASVTSSSSMFNAVVSIVTQDGKLLSSTPSKNGAASTETLLPGPGRYAVLISPNAIGTEGQYQLNVSYALAPSGGGTILSGEAVQGTLNDADFTDTWRIEAQPNTTLTVDLSRLAGDVNLNLAVYGPDGKEIPVDKDKNKVVLSAGGTSMLIISRAGGAGDHTSGTYRLQVTTS